MGTNTKVILPDFIEASIVALYPRYSEEKLAEATANWAEQIAFNEKRIAETENVVLKPDRTQQTTDHLKTFIRAENWGCGQVINPTNMIGVSNNRDFTRFLTTGENQHATVVAKLSATTTGDVYVVGKLGSTGAGKNGNYVMVWGSETGVNDTWDYIGHTKITTTGPELLYVGTAQKPYLYVTVGCNTYTSRAVTYNDIELDCVYFMH